jgi:hypothetical protein
MSPRVTDSISGTPARFRSTSVDVAAVVDRLAGVLLEVDARQAHALAVASVMPPPVQ